MTGLLIVGAGGHGKVVADTACEMGRWNKVAFVDDRYPSLTEVFCWPVIGRFDEIEPLLSEYSDIAVAIGNNHLRIDLLKRFMAMGFSLPAVIHPTAFVSSRSEINDGVVIFAHAVINVGAEIGLGCIINTATTVDHDCILSEGVHLSPGVNLAGEVSIGSCSWLGVGSSVIQKIEIGNNVIVGAGAAVISDIVSNVTVVGVPAKVIKKNT